jgi:hypothetical protein
MSRQQPVRPGQISGLTARAARLSRTAPAEAAACLAAKADPPDRIAASREQDGRARCDTGTARQAAAALTPED